MIGHGAKLSRKRQQAIAALIEAPTIREAAGIVGIGEATLFRWLQDANFQFHGASPFCLVFWSKLL
jgi:hypothetical protein